KTSRNTLTGSPPPQEQEPPGSEEAMRPQPVYEDPEYRASGKLKDRVALITGADSGIGRAVAILFAKEGADVCVAYLNEHKDAEVTMNRVTELGRRAVRMAGDIGDPVYCEQLVQKTIDVYGRIDILVNNAAEQAEISGVA